MTDDVRDEAQKFVAAALAAAQFAFRNPGAAKWMADRALSQFATGTEECCVCPVCRAIAAVRDPSPEFAARLASGASDLAAGVTAILRAFGDKPAPAPRSTPPHSTPPHSTGRDAGPTWRAATKRATDDDEDWPVPEAAEDDDPWHAATTAPPPASVPRES